MSPLAESAHGRAVSGEVAVGKVSATSLAGERRVGSKSTSEAGVVYPP